MLMWVMLKVSYISVVMYWDVVVGSEMNVNGLCGKGGYRLWG